MTFKQFKFWLVYIKKEGCFPVIWIPAHTKITRQMIDYAKKNKIKVIIDKRRPAVCGENYWRLKPGFITKCPA